jgi:hypothetical protein
MLACRSNRNDRSQETIFRPRAPEAITVRIGRGFRASGLVLVCVALVSSFFALFGCATKPHWTEAPGAPEAYREFVIALHNFQWNKSGTRLWFAFSASKGQSVGTGIPSGGGRIHWISTPYYAYAADLETGKAHQEDWRDTSGYPELLLVGGWVNGRYGIRWDGYETALSLVDRISGSQRTLVVGKKTLTYGHTTLRGLR